MNTRVALITGAAARLGAATARELHAHGWNVVIHCRRSADTARQLAAELDTHRPDSVRVIEADLARNEDIDRLATEAVTCFGRLDALVNNASSFYPTPAGRISASDWDDLFAANARAPLFLSQALTPALRKHQGAIINMADIHGLAPLREHTVYCMAKAALIMMTRSLALELAPAIRVNAIAPGAILWPEKQPDLEQQERIMSGIPAQRLGTPEDIARSVRFLLDSPYITGQVLSVDGGRQL